MKKYAVFLPCKNPWTDSVKTRLSKDIGLVKAKQIYESNLKALVREHTNQEYDLFLSVSSNTSLSFFDKFKKIKILKLKSNGLADSLAESFELLKNYDKTIVIASDCVIGHEFVLNAFERINDNTVVISPALDGGYNLLGMSKNLDLFSNITMSTNTVFLDTLNLIKKQMKDVKILEKTADFDYLTDVSKMYELTKSRKNFRKFNKLLEKLLPTETNIHT